MQASFHQSESIHISPKYEAEHRKDNAKYHSKLRENCILAPGLAACYPCPAVWIPGQQQRQSIK